MCISSRCKVKKYIYIYARLLSSFGYFWAYFGYFPILWVAQLYLMVFCTELLGTTRMFFKLKIWWIFLCWGFFRYFLSILYECSSSKSSQHILLLFWYISFQMWLYEFITLWLKRIYFISFQLVSFLFFIWLITV